MKRHQNDDYEHNAENSEPACLKPGRRYYEVQRGTNVVPDAVVVACVYAKPVLSWAKVTIESLPPGAWLLPGCVPTFQFVTKAYLLRDHKAQCRVINFEITRKRRKTKILARRIALAVGNDLFNVHRRRQSIPGQMPRINHLEHDTICKPQPSIGRSCCRPKRSASRLHTVKCIKSRNVHNDVRLPPPSLHFHTRNFDEPALRV